jgi:putative Mg2+ transporter-C (MgtC) family protein
MEHEILLQVALAVVTGALVGAEREYRSKSAGFRTMILISVGATVLTYCSILIGSPNSPDRIASNIATGIGFIGAGAIFRGDNRVSGITTAATIWAVAAMGMLIGSGQYIDACGICVVILFIQLGLVFFEQKIDRYNQVRTYRIVCKYEHKSLNVYQKGFEEHKLRMIKSKQTKTKDLIMGTWEVAGHANNHEKFVKEILKDDQVIDFEF